MKTFCILIALAASTAIASAQGITGTIQIDRKLTRHSVTASVPIYQRGPAVKLGKDAADSDPLAFEKEHVVIYLEGSGLPSSPAVHTAPPTMQQVNRQFAPDLLIVPAGSAVSFPNMDPIFHNIFSLSKPKTFDLGSYDKGESRSVVFAAPGVVSVYCHLHPNMSGTVVVTPNRWYARSDRAGHYEIHDIPPGKYTLVAWHKSAGYIRKPVVVEATEDAVVNFNVPITDEMQERMAKKDMQMNMGSGR